MYVYLLMRNTSHIASSNATFCLECPWLLLLDINHAILIQKYGTICILTKSLRNAIINILHNIKVGFQKVISIYLNLRLKTMDVVGKNCIQACCNNTVIGQVRSE